MNERRHAARKWYHPFGILFWIGRNEWVILVLIGLIFGGIWAFAKLADEVLEGETHDFDTAVILALRQPDDLSDPIGPRWFEEMMRDMTALGGVGVLTLMTAGVCVFLLLMNKKRSALLVFGAVGGGMLLSFLLKHGFSRPRPDLVPHGSYVVTSSFPSGHSMMSAVTYLTLGGLLGRISSRYRIKIFFLSCAILLTVLVGFSRIYLGVHWPTDVLGGWTIGATWALLCWVLALWLQKRGRVEQIDEDLPGRKPGSS